LVLASSHLRGVFLGLSLYSRQFSLKALYPSAAAHSFINMDNSIVLRDGGVSANY